MQAIASVHYAWYMNRINNNYYLDSIPGEFGDKYVMLNMGIRSQTFGNSGILWLPGSLDGTSAQVGLVHDLLD